MNTAATKALYSYTREAMLAGCPRDQARNFLVAGIVLQKRQLLASALARRCDEADGPLAIGYGGARGGGKSHWLLAQMGADDCQRVPGLKCLLLRKVGKANMENMEDLRKRLFSRLPHELQVHRGILTFENGSRIVAGHFQSEKDIDAYLGLEYDVIGIEEATTLTARKYADIRTCARSSRIVEGRHWRPRIYSTTNPGGVGHAWYKTEFIERSGRLEDPSLPGRTCFVPARVTDNPFINPEYSQNLELLSGWQRAAWLDGSWDIAAGQFFTHFDPAAHVIPEEQVEVPERVRWIAGFDYGFAHWSVFLLAFHDEKGITVVDELALRQSVPSVVASGIRACCRRWGIKPEQVTTMTGADVCRRESNGVTIQDQYQAAGVRLVPGVLDRVSGWARVLQRLGDPSRGIPPTLRISSRCQHLLTRLPAMQVDPNRAEDVLKVDCDEDGEGGDDSVDALRYLAGTRLFHGVVLLQL